MSHTFSELGVPQQLIGTLEQRGITAPFPIQAATIADALAGRDLCGRAPTGSGKTLAYSIPLAVTAGRGQPRRPHSLVLVPTRELASQVAEELRPLAQARGRSVATFYGGTNLSRDQRCLRQGVDIAIACPGRLADLVRRGDADLSQVEFAVVDEADRMADMGFLPEVKRLLDQTSEQRQTLLFSATLDGDVDVLIRRYQHEPARHELGGSSESTGDVRHFFWHAQPSERVGYTREVLESVSPAIVFTRTKHAADRVSKQLNRQGVRSAAIHGNRSQNQRERALSDFAQGRVSALVATDVAARGIHVDEVGVVVHYDPPSTSKDYVHRSGRTGRAGADGLVVTFVAPDNIGDVKGLQRALSMRQQVDPFAVASLSNDAGRNTGQQRVAAPRSDAGKQPSEGRPTQASPSSRGSGNQSGRSDRGNRSNRSDRSNRSNRGRGAAQRRRA